MHSSSLISDSIPKVREDEQLAAQQCSDTKNASTVRNGRPSDRDGWPESVSHILLVHASNSNDMPNELRDHV